MLKASENMTFRYGLAPRENWKKKAASVPAATWQYYPDLSPETAKTLKVPVQALVSWFWTSSLEMAALMSIHLEVVGDQMPRNLCPKLQSHPPCGLDNWTDQLTPPYLSPTGLC